MEEVAVLDTHHTQILKRLRGAFTSLRLELLMSRRLANHPQNGVARNNFTADINVYGNFDDVASLNSILSDAGIFLQEPEQSDPSVTYRNPHVLSWDDQDGTPRFRSMLPSVEAHFENTVEGILEELEAVPPHTEVTQDPRICSVLRRWVLLLKFIRLAWFILTI